MKPWRRYPTVPGRVFDTSYGETAYGSLEGPSTRLPEAKPEDQQAFTDHIQDPLEIRSAA